MKIVLGFIIAIAIAYQSYSQARIDSILVDGHYRTFRFQEPRLKTNKRNLIFILHGSGGDGQGMMKPAASLQAIAEDEKLLLVYPDGFERYWNECRRAATSTANRIDINEQAFFTAILQYFGKNYQVIDKRFFVIGLSGGGHMAYKLAMTLPETCKGISSVVANLPDKTNMDCAEAKIPVAVMIANGTADPLNPYSGGTMIMSGASWGDVRSTQRSFQYWAGLAGYKDQPLIEKMPDPDTTNKQAITRYTYRNSRKPEVTLLQVDGGEHAFPKDLDIFLESWAFFKREIKREERTGR
ncbi:poly(3-hydroxybutyrate) depolymerase [Segetibacter sp. 3557_3]|uniref:alpha/beta hydrolase family esterase n=1 Tax=Segetibacter sp. 3557_3 TaxID=2547429 RepID=UPI001058A29B|nr:poly(3-hydroxybutyrate) depolymerase [Segetibacter sp. 3557_3]TDH26945.1 poly(3-hydroxybutyrate) depolymerase [Segetibacter sp. 3557_3]